MKQFNPFITSVFMNDSFFKCSFITRTTEPQLLKNLFYITDESVAWTISISSNGKLLSSTCQLRSVTFCDAFFNLLLSQFSNFITEKQFYKRIHYNGFKSHFRSRNNHRPFSHYTRSSIDEKISWGKLSQW